jgi:hypothetical protein
MELQCKCIQSNFYQQWIFFKNGSYCLHNAVMIATQITWHKNAVKFVEYRQGIGLTLDQGTRVAYGSAITITSTQKLHTESPPPVTASIQQP